MKLGADGARQGAEERSSLLSKLLFSKYDGSHKGRIEGESEISILTRFLKLTSLKSEKQTSSETQSTSIPIETVENLESDNKKISLSSSLSTTKAEARSRYYSSISSPSYSPATVLVTSNNKPTSLAFSAGERKPPR